MNGAYPENFVKIRLLVEDVDTFCGMGMGTGTGTGWDGTHRDYIDNLSLSFGFGPGLWLGLRFVNIYFQNSLAKR